MISSVVDLANFSPGFWDLCLNRPGFQVLRCVVGSRFGHFLCSDFGHFACSEYNFGFWLFLPVGFPVFAHFYPGVRVLVPPKPPSLLISAKQTHVSRRIC